MALFLSASATSLASKKWSNRSTYWDHSSLSPSNSLTWSIAVFFFLFVFFVLFFFYFLFESSYQHVKGHVNCSVLSTRFYLFSFYAETSDEKMRPQ